MTTTPITPARSVDSVVKWLIHQGYNIDVVTLVANTGGIAAGTSLMGKLAMKSAGVWKNVIAGDTVSGTSELGIILRRELVLAAVAGAASITNVPMLTQGPAMVHHDGLSYGGQTESTCNTALLAKGIKVVDEVGILYDPVQG